MNDIEKLRAKHAEELAHAEQENAIAMQLPIPPHRVHGFKPCPWITYKRATLAECVEVFRAFSVVPFGTFKDPRGGSLSLKPETIIKPREGETLMQWETDCARFACAIDVSQGSYGPSAQLVFYADVSDTVMRIACEFGQGYIGACPQLSARMRRHGGRVVRGSIERNSWAGSLSDRTIKWTTGSDETDGSAHFEYLFCVDQDETGAEHSHAIGQLVNLADNAKV